MKRVLLFGLFILFMITVVPNEPVIRGTEHEFFVIVSNPSDTKYDDVRTKAYILDAPDTDIIYSNQYDLPKRESSLSRMRWEVDSGMPPGEYVVKVVVRNEEDNLRDSKLWFFEVY